MYFALRDELHEYLEHVADRFDVRRHIRFATEVERLAYDADAQRWDVTPDPAGRHRRERRANVVISATGIFNPLKFPDINGLDRFDGPRPTPRSGPTTSTSPASASRSSATAPAPCRSARRSRTTSRR